MLKNSVCETLIHLRGWEPLHRQAVVMNRWGIRLDGDPARKRQKHVELFPTRTIPDQRTEEDCLNESASYEQHDQDWDSLFALAHEAIIPNA